MNTVLVTGTGVQNKGAELLLVAAREALLKNAPETKIAVPLSFGTYEERSRYQLRTLLPEEPVGRWWLAGKLMPKSFRDKTGLTAERDISVILDASGFAFGDQLGEARTAAFAKDVRRWRNAGKKIVLLPQALGPFANPAIRSSFKSVVENVDLIFARDKTSFGHLNGLSADHASRFRLAPDFTNLLHPIGCKSTAAPAQILIVPNYQMIAKASETAASEYVPFLARCWREAVSHGLSCAILLHDDTIDAMLVDPLRKEIAADVTVIQERDPVELKRILGSARVVIGSRFHALVGALSQNVPVIAAGWSHKYEMLLGDYQCDDLILPVSASSHEIHAVFSKLLTDLESWRDRIADCGRELVRQAEAMWRETLEVTGLKPA